MNAFILSLVNYMAHVGLRYSRINLANEDKLAFDVASLLKAWTLEQRLNAVWFKVANEGTFSKTNSKALFGLKLKSMGKLNGVSDFVILQGNKCLCLELKYGKNGLSEDQKVFQSWCNLAKVHFAVIRTIEELEPLLKKLQFMGDNHDEDL